jgi:PAS domain S-box-containing protein
MMRQMNDLKKTKAQLAAELAALRRRVAILEAGKGASARAGARTARDSAPGAADHERSRLQAILTAVVECLPFEFFAIGSDGRYILQNAITRAHYGELIGKRPEDCAPDAATRRLWLENNRRAFAGQRVEEEIEARVGGRKRHYYNIITPIRDGDRCYGILGVNVDITERNRAELALRKVRDGLERRIHRRTAELTRAIRELQDQVDERQRAQEALRHSEELYRTLVETSPDAVIRADLEGHITFASHSILALHGSDSVQELLGRNPLDFFAPEDHARFAANLRRVVEEGALRDAGYTCLRKDGTRFPGEVSAAVIRDAAGKPAALSVLVRDVTERRKAEEALRKQQRTLRHLLQSSDHERQLIAYEIHDGLAQQLAGAIMQFQAFAHLKDTEPKNAGKAYDAGMTLLRQGHSEARRLISGVRPPILDEAGIVTAVAHLVEERRRRKGPKIELRTRVEFDRLVPVLENAVYRIVQEGLSNACRHSHSPKVSIELLQQGDRLRIEVRDWGVGFDPNNVKDTCFGLEGIRQRARLLEGQVRLETAPGKGTRLRVELPVVPSGSEV